MDTVIDLAKQLNVAQLIPIGVMMWFFYSRLDMKIEKLDKKLDLSVGRLETKIDKLDEKVTDIDRRVCRMEGALTNKECCMLKDNRTKEKAE